MLACYCQMQSANIIGIKLFTLASIHVSVNIPLISDTPTNLYLQQKLLQLVLTEQQLKAHLMIEFVCSLNRNLLMNHSNYVTDICGINFGEVANPKIHIYSRSNE